MDERGLAVFEFSGYVARETEIWVLIDGTWDEARYICFGTKDLGERI